MNHFSSNLYMFPELQDSSGAMDKLGTKSPVSRILRAGYICDIIRDPHTEPAIHHWLVQDCDTDEIIGLGQARTLAEAERHAVSFLDDLRLRRAV